jgi:hypothetical protein
MLASTSKGCGMEVSEIVRADRGCEHTENCAGRLLLQRPVQQRLASDECKSAVVTTANCTTDWNVVLLSHNTEDISIVSIHNACYSAVVTLGL